MLPSSQQETCKNRGKNTANTYIVTTYSPSLVYTTSIKKDKVKLFYWPI